MSSPAQSKPNDQPFYKKFLQFIGLDRSCDTAEDLGHEIQELIEDGEEQGIISKQEGLMLSSIFDFRETLAKEIMTPRTSMICAPATATVPDIVSLIIEKGYTRIPIYSESPDHITGILHAKDLLQYCSSTAKPPLAGEITIPAIFIQETHKIVDLLKDFKSKKVHMGIVVDEFGSVRGLLTLEDILEEIVGEIADEYDQDTTRWTVVDDNTVLTDAKIDIEEIESFFKTQMPEGTYESIGGLIIQTLGKLPSPGVSVTINNLKFYVISASKRRINTVKVQKIS